MRVGNNSPVSQVLRAYTQQLRGEYSKARRESEIKQAPAKGFEQVSLSREALTLAATNAQSAAVTQESDSIDEPNQETEETRAETAAEGDSAEATEGGPEESPASDANS